MARTATPTTAAPRPVTGHRARFGGRVERRRARLADASGILGLATLVFVVGLWLSGGEIQVFEQPGGPALSLGRLSGLLAAALLLIQVLLMARIPLLERAWGQDVLARRHRIVGFTSFSLMLVHIALSTIGYAQAGNESLLAQAWDLSVNYPGMLLAVAGSAALVMVVVTSVKAARRRMRHESWHLLHLYAYLGVGLALPHQLWTGQEFLTSPVATAFWWGMWAVAAAAILAFRVLVPVGRSWYHRMAVEQVLPEAEGVVSVIIHGRHLDQLPLRAGQYFQWRFLAGSGWSRAHPYSISGMPTTDRLRITVHTAGDDGERIATLAPGTRVGLEGPYGALTAERRTRRDVLLLAAGVGVTPLRALAEEIATEPPADDPGRFGRQGGTSGRSGVARPSVVLLHRVSTERDGLFGSELSALSTRANVRIIRLAGPRGRAGSWLPDAAGGADSAAALRALVPDVAEREVYLCGPAAWMAAAAATLRELGVAKSAIRREDFAM